VLTADFILHHEKTALCGQHRERYLQQPTNVLSKRFDVPCICVLEYASKERRFLQQMYGTQSAGISPAQKANRVRLSQQILSQAEVQQSLRCLKRRAVCKTATANEIG
jgi:hypothetical protein